MSLLVEILIYIVAFGISDIVIAQCCGQEPRCRVIYFATVFIFAMILS